MRRALYLLLLLSVSERYPTTNADPLATGPGREETSVRPKENR